MTLKDVCAYNLDGDFDELFRDVEIKSASDAAICAVEALTAQEIVLDMEAMKEVKGKHRTRLVPRDRPHRSPKYTLPR